MTTHAFIYDRHATDTRTILDLRLARCLAYAKDNGWHIAGTWLDLGDNALGDQRPQFDALCTAMTEATGTVVCLVDTFDRLSRAAGHQAVMRRRIAAAGGHCETTDGETDTDEEKRRGCLSTPH